MVRAMAGETPEMMASHPMNWVALVILISWLATPVSTVATPAMSERRPGPGLGNLGERLVHHVGGAHGIDDPHQRQQQDPSQMG